jgi:hypothetical protein
MNIHNEIYAWKRTLNIIKSQLPNAKIFLKGGAPLALHVLSLLPNHESSFNLIQQNKLIKDWDFTICAEQDKVATLLPDDFILTGTAIKVLRHRDASKYLKPSTFDYEFAALTQDYIFESSVFPKESIIVKYSDMEVPITLFHIELITIQDINNLFDMLLCYYSKPILVNQIINYARNTNIQQLPSVNGFFQVNNLDYGKLCSFKPYLQFKDPITLQFILSTYNQIDRLLMRLPMKILPKSNKIKNLLTNNNLPLPSWILNEELIEKTIIDVNQHLHDALFKASYDCLINTLDILLNEQPCIKTVQNMIKSITYKLTKLDDTNPAYISATRDKEIINVITKEQTNLKTIIDNYPSLYPLVLKNLSNLTNYIQRVFETLDSFFNYCNIIRVYEILQETKKRDMSLYDDLLSNIKKLFKPLLLSSHTKYSKVIYDIKLLQKSYNTYTFFRLIEV